MKTFEKDNDFCGQRFILNMEAEWFTNSKYVNV